MMKNGCFMVLLFSACISNAEEVITKFISDIQIANNGIITVAETIEVAAENVNIKRGIYRDFPTQYFDSWMTKKSVGFKVFSVTRNGQPEPFHTQEMINGIRVYIGSSSVTLPKGLHQYQIIYQTNKQIGHFDGYDEFYWNVTGTGWMFSILKASTRIQLPEKGHQLVLDQRAWTGYQGQQEQNYTINKTDSFIGFETTQKLEPYQGLTIGIQFPKGLVMPEPFDFSGFINDNLLWLISVILLLFYLGFYLIAWYRFGRDPKKGVLITRFYPPKGLSPAAVHFIDNGRANNHTLTAAILSLATKGYVAITQLKDQYRLNLLKPEKQVTLSDGEKALKEKLFTHKRKELIIRPSLSTALFTGRQKLFSLLKKEFQNKCFVDNRSYVLWGCITSLFVLFVGTLLLYQQTLSVTELISLIFSSGILIVIAVAFLMASPILASTILILLLAASYMDLIQFVVTHQKWIYFVLFLSGVNLLFAYLLRAPTVFGRHIKDEIDGLKLYMKSAEEARLDTLNPPDKTIEHYEQLLPYAIALGLENQWSEKFASVINSQTSTPTSVQTNYQPAWFTTENDSMDLSDFSVSKISRSLRNTVATASVIPSASGSSSSSSYSSSSYGSSSSSYSSSSSSGGSSGGGGGGGGGGGW